MQRFLRGETPAWQGAKRAFARAPCFSREAKGLDPKAEHAHLCVCGGLDWAGERLRREVAGAPQ